MDKVLILTCSTGEGHNSAARALEKAFARNGITCQLRDPVSFRSERMQKVVSSLYNDTIRKAPSVFGAVYKLGDIYSSTKLPSPVYYANSHYSGALKSFILENEFDAVVCTHLYGMEAMTAIRRDPEFRIPCYGVMTDYVCIPFLEETDLDAYFVPCREVLADMIQKGIPEEKLILTGIPVNDSFHPGMDREEARRELNLSVAGKIFLVMTGGVGCENMEGICESLLREIRQEDLLIVLTGKNEELKNRLDGRYGSDARLRTVSFTRQVPAYMAASDVLLSKPGGLSSTEAAAANIPLVHIYAIPGCETYNARYFSEHGLSMAADNKKDAVAFAKMLAYHREEADRMRENQRRLIHADAADRIVRQVSGNAQS